MTLQPISVNLFQQPNETARRVATPLPNSKGLKKNRFLLNGLSESEKDRYLIAYKGKLMTEKPKAPCLRGRFVLLQVQEGEKIYYLWANRNSLVKRLGIDRKSLPKTYDYSTFIKQKMAERGPNDVQINNPPPQEEDKPQELTKEERAKIHTAYLSGGKPTEESKKRMKMAYEIGIYLLSYIKKSEANKNFQDGVNPYFPKFWDPFKDQHSRNPEYQNARHLVRGLALEGDCYFCTLRLHTPFGEWKLGLLEDEGAWEKIKNDLGLERDQNPDHARLSIPIYRITKWKGEALDKLEYTQVAPEDFSGERLGASDPLMHEVSHFPGIDCLINCPNHNLEDRKQEKEKNTQILSDIVQEQGKKG